LCKIWKRATVPARNGSTRSTADEASKAMTPAHMCTRPAPRISSHQCSPPNSDEAAKQGIASSSERESSAVALDAPQPGGDLRRIGSIRLPVEVGLQIQNGLTGVPQRCGEEAAIARLLETPRGERNAQLDGAEGELCLAALQVANLDVVEHA